MSNKKDKSAQTVSVVQGQAMNQKLWIGITGAVLLIIISIYGASYSSVIGTVNAEEITVYKSATCGCCKNWVSHLENNGFDVNAHNRNDMPSIKKQYGVAPQQQSCHTAIINGYVIEGHVPAADIKRLLTEKPDIKGLTVPGMVMGSPGMEGPRKDAYNVLAIDRQGNTSVYSQY